MTERPYVGFRTFCKVSTDVAKPYAIVGFPTDGATSFRPGARFGPSAIREASMMLTDGQHPRCEIKLEDYLFDAGDIDIFQVVRFLQALAIVRGKLSDERLEGL